MLVVVGFVEGSQFIVDDVMIMLPVRVRAVAHSSDHFGFLFLSYSEYPLPLVLRSALRLHPQTFL